MTEPLDADLVKDAFAEVSSPGRLEVIRRSPTILLDAAHNPHGAQATAEAIEDSFLLNPLIGVVGVMADKDYEGVLAAFEPVMAAIVCTENTTTRTMRAEDLAEVARGIFGIDRVYVAPGSRTPSSRPRPSRRRAACSVRRSAPAASSSPGPSSRSGRPGTCSSPGAAHEPVDPACDVRRDAGAPGRRAVPHRRRDDRDDRHRRAGLARTRARPGGAVRARRGDAAAGPAATRSAGPSRSSRSGSAS